MKKGDVLIRGYFGRPETPRDVAELRSRKTGTIHIADLLFDGGFDNQDFSEISRLGELDNRGGPGRY